MHTILQTTFWNTFSCLKIIIFCFEFPWNLFPMVQLTISKHWFRYWLGTEQVTCHYLNQWLPYLLTYELAPWGKNKMATVLQVQHFLEKKIYYYTPRFNEVERGVYWYHLVRLSVCGQNRVRSVSSTILIGSISYLHILSSNIRECVACNARFKIQKFEILANFLKFVTLTLSSFDLGSNMTQWYG